MYIYTVLLIAYVALLLCGVALLLIWRRIRRIEKEVFKTPLRRNKVKQE